MIWVFLRFYYQNRDNFISVQVKAGKKNIYRYSFGYNYLQNELLKVKLNSGELHINYVWTKFPIGFELK